MKIIEMYLISDVMELGDMGGGFENWCQFGIKSVWQLDEYGMRCWPSV